MKIIVSKGEFYSKLSAVSKVIPGKTSLVILEHVLMEVNGNNLTLLASDGETVISNTMTATNESNTDVKVCFDSKKVLEALKDLAEQGISIEIDETHQSITFATQNGNFSIMYDKGVEYPMIAVEENQDKKIEMKASELLPIISSALGFTADDELRPVLNGIYFDVKEDGLYVVATDAHALFLKHIESVKGEVPMSFIMPKKPTTILKGILAKNDDVVTITFGEKNVSLVFGTTKVVCRQIEGRYPNYNAVFPNNDKVLRVSKQDILNTTKRVSVFANNWTHMVKLAVSENMIQMEAQDIDFSTSAKEKVACKYNDAPMSIGFKSDYIVNIFGQMDEDMVEIKLADSARAAVFVPHKDGEESNTLMMLMPMLLNV